MTPLSRREDQALLFVVMAAVIWRWVLAQRTPVPSEDGSTYLWMAQQFAAGHWHDGFATVFPPGLSLLLAPLLALGLEPLFAAQLLGCITSGLTTVPLALVAHTLRPGAAVPAAILFAAASLPSRNAAEVYSEPPFLLLLALGTLAGLRHHYWRLGICSALAFLLRPEAVLLPLAFALTDRRALRALLAAAAGVLLLALLRWLSGNGLDPLPIRSFHELRDDLPERGAVLANLLQVPKAFAEAFELMAPLPLLLLLPPRLVPRGTRPLLLQLALNTLVICTFVVRSRFFLSAAVPVVALAAVGTSRLRLPWRCAALALCAGLGLYTGWNGVIDADRAVERGVGRYLAHELHPGEQVAGDMPRVIYYAGRRPPEPRHFDATQLLAMAAAADVHFVVLSRDTKRGTFAPVSAGLEPRFARLQLPEGLQEPAEARGIVVFVRR